MTPATGRRCRLGRERPDRRQRVVTYRLGRRSAQCWRSVRGCYAVRVEADGELLALFESPTALQAVRAVRAAVGLAGPAPQGDPQFKVTHYPLPRGRKEGGTT